MSTHREFPRSVRVASTLQRELADLIREGISDPRLDGVTITEVALSSDLSHAKVYISRLGRPTAEACALLNEYVPRLRHLVAKRVRLRLTPQLVFTDDPLPDDADHIARLIRDARARDGSGGDEG
jgi:ribosome-binding factor A